MTTSLPLRELRRHLEQQEPRYIELLRHMVEVNSFTTNPDGIRALGELTAVPFETLGFAAERVPAEKAEFGDHLFLTRPSPRAAVAPTLLLVSHLDTVFSPEEERRNDFRWRESGERLYGPGTVDAKGGTVVAFMILDALAAVAPESLDAVRWVVALNAAEERSAADFGPLCRQRLDPRAGSACLVFEGGHIDGGKSPLVVCRKGMAIFDVDVEGRSAHAGSGHARGANAVVQLAEVISRIAGWTDYERDLTFNVGPVRGGELVNRVPESATARVELRTFDPAVFDEARRRMLALEGHSTVASPADGYRCRVRVRELMQTDPWPRNPASDSLLEVWRGAAAELGFEIPAEHRGGLSDGNHLWRAVPTMDGLGPDGSNAHCSERSDDGGKDQEYAIRPSFVAKALLGAAGLLRLIDSPVLLTPRASSERPAESAPLVG